MQTLVLALAGVVFLLAALFTAGAFGNECGKIISRPGEGQLKDKTTAEDTEHLVFTFTVSMLFAVLSAACLLFAM